MVDPKYLRKDGGIKNLGVPPEIKTQWFIEKAREVHGGLYDYSEQVYTKSVQKLNIICPKHGTFQQSPNNHIKQQQGCPKCALEAQSVRLQDSREQFIEKQRQVHGDSFTYENVNYVNCMTKVTITCPTHGGFPQTPDNHIRGRQGCPYCKGKTANIVYMLRCLDTGLVKIGITKDLQRRAKEIGNVNIVCQIRHPDPRQLETRLHIQLKQSRKTNQYALSGNTEFFDLSDTQVCEVKEQLLREII